MNIQDVARMLGRTVGTVRSYCKSEDLPFRREGGRLVFDEAEVREWMGRPETQSFLGWGELIKNGRRVPQNAAGSAA